MAGCPFCGIAAGSVPARVLGGTPSSVAFLDASPLAEGHALVVPRAHRELLQDMRPDECADLFELVRRVAARAAAAYGPSLVAVHNGRGAGQEVPHVHAHVIPRAEGDGAGPVHSMFRPGAAAGADRALARMRL